MPIIDSMNMTNYIEKVYNGHMMQGSRSGEPYGSFYRWTKKDIEAVYKTILIFSIKKGIDFYFNNSFEEDFAITRSLKHFKKNIWHEGDYTHLYNQITDLTQLPTLVTKVNDQRWIVMTEWGKHQHLQSPQCRIEDLDFNYKEYSQLMEGIE
jgi:hypothetical protein